MWILLGLSSIYIWFQYFKGKQQLEIQYNELQQHIEKHNCVVSYSKIHGITGWPGFNMKIYKPHISSEDALEPLLYFINTANKTLDIAVMALTSNTLTDALISVAKKGVTVRLITDYDAMIKGSCLKRLMQSGIEVILYLGSQDRYGSIFHYKYAIKDYKTDFPAICCGSLNWTNTAFTNHYENIVFTTNKLVLDKFYSNYIQSLECIKQLTKDDLYVRIKLHELKKTF